MTNILIMISVMGLSFLVGYFLISKVPPLLHTPLMSMTNAISAITILGGLIIFSFETTAEAKIIGCLALVLAAFNVVGGFAITDRMIRLFKSEQKK